jgi:hypothetical protein
VPSGTLLKGYCAAEEVTQSRGADSLGYEWRDWMRFSVMAEARLGTIRNGYMDGRRREHGCLHYPWMGERRNIKDAGLPRVSNLSKAGPLQHAAAWLFSLTGRNARTDVRFGTRLGTIFATHNSFGGGVVS